MQMQVPVGLSSAAPRDVATAPRIPQRRTSPLKFQPGLTPQMMMIARCNKRSPVRYLPRGFIAAANLSPCGRTNRKARSSLDPKESSGSHPEYKDRCWTISPPCRQRE